MAANLYTIVSLVDVTCLHHNSAKSGGTSGLHVYLDKVILCMLTISLFPSGRFHRRKAKLYLHA